ncbi:hypothetical protein [Dokdonella sp.]|uniref:hypothetical protein n=1 Tax=Dokdonella sp. TaxID=2291710 RepID=UPI003529142A
MNAPAPAPSKGHPAAVWIIAGVSGFFVVAVFVLAGSFLWVGFQEFSEQARTAIRNDPDIRAAVGEIRDIHFDLTATGDAPGDEEFAFRVEGSRASGLLVGRFVTVNANTEDLRSGQLFLEDGRVIQFGGSVQD